MAKGSSSQQFEQLLEQHQRILFKVIHTYCRHPDDRQDLFQEIALQLWKAFPRYDEKRSFTTWMYRIALNVAISFARSSRHWERFAAPFGEREAETIAISQPETDERVLALYALLERFDPLNRALLLLYLEEHRYAEIAEILGITETNVATRISRLKQRIRKDAAERETI